jgi:L-lactate dehydrogenase complex protein LldG
MGNSREKILLAIKQHQGVTKDLPEGKIFPQSFDPVSRYTAVLKSIGGKVYHIRNLNEIEEQLQKDLGDLKRVVSAVPGFSSAEMNRQYDDLTSLHNVDLFITQSFLGVAENGAVWLKDEALYERVLPFISKHVAVIIDQRNIIATMHEAYEQIGNSDYGFGTFIAGPSKTADIEQSLVLGAHGAMTMTVFIKIDN